MAGKLNYMENKTTIELLGLLEKITDNDYGIGGKYEKIMAELETREPFLQILGEDYDTSLPAVWETIKELQEEIKKLKRHKHDSKNGDVLIRI